MPTWIYINVPDLPLPFETQRWVCGSWSICDDASCFPVKGRKYCFFISDLKMRIWIVVPITAMFLEIDVKQQTHKGL